MSEHKTLCDLGLITVDFGSSDRDTGNTFRLTFRHRSGTQTGRIEVEQAEAEQFAIELSAVMAAMVAQLRSPPQSK
jgi:hypothetical protein